MIFYSNLEFDSTFLYHSRRTSNHTFRNLDITSLHGIFGVVVTVIHTNSWIQEPGSEISRCKSWDGTFNVMTKRRPYWTKLRNTVTCVVI